MYLELTDRTLMEWLEYVLRKATLPGPSFGVLALVTRSLVFGSDALLFARCGRSLPTDDDEESVSSEFESCSGRAIEGTNSAGASRPFLVVVPDIDREPNEKRPLALGADATRRMKREAVAPTDLGLRGPLLVRER